MKTLDVLECSAFLKVDRTTVLRLAQDGELPGCRIGHAWVFLLDEMVEYLRAKTREQQRDRRERAMLDAVTDRTDPLVVPMSALRRQVKRKAPPALPSMEEITQGTTGLSPQLARQ